MHTDYWYFIVDVTYRMYTLEEEQGYIMHKLTTDELITAIKAISTTFPRFDFENTLEGAELTLYHKLWLEFERRNQLVARFNRIVEIREENARIEEERNASIRSQAGQYSAAHEMIMDILDQ